jgi:nicotinamidase-related amidase
MSDKTALVIIDAQVNMFEEGCSVFEGETLLQKLRRLIGLARGASAPVVYVQNNGGEGDPDQPGTPGWQIHPDVAPLPGDLIIQKHSPDSFHETNLQDELAACQMSGLVIAGMQTEMCIDATCRRAHELGYEVTLVEDAHSTFDGALTAVQTIAEYNDVLRKIIRLEKAANVSF